MKNLRAKRLVIGMMVAVIVTTLTACRVEGNIIISDDLSWAMAPDTKYYLVEDGAEPADNYWELRYNEQAGVYYTTYPYEEETFVTPDCKPISLDMEGYEYLGDIPLRIEDHGDRNDYYIYADGTKAFGSKTYCFASDFVGDYAQVHEKNKEELIPALIDKQGEVVFQAKNEKSQLIPLKGDLYVEITPKGARIFHVETGETVKILPGCDDVEKTSEGYIVRDYGKEPDTCQLLDENFKPLWEGKTFLALREVRGGKDPIYCTGDGEKDVYFRHSGKVILEVPEYTSVYSPENDTILVYTPNALICYDKEGKEIFSKKTERAIVPEEVWYRDGFFNGMAVVTLDGSKYGIIDEEGRDLTKYVFDYGKIAKDGTVLISYQRKAGVLWGAKQK